DVVVLRVKDDIDAATAHAYSDVLRQVFPDNRAVILQPGQDLEVVTPSDRRSANLMGALPRTACPWCLEHERPIAKCSELAWRDCGVWLFPNCEADMKTSDSGAAVREEEE